MRVGGLVRCTSMHEAPSRRSPTLDDLPGGSAERVLLQVASWQLPGGASIDPVADDLQAERLVGLATTARLLGPLLVAVDVGALELRDEFVEAIVAGHEGSMLWCMHLEVRLLEVMDWFDQAGGIEFLVVKGPAVAHLDEIDPILRSFADLDLLVRADDMDRALVALEGHGAVRRVPQRRPGFDRRFIKSVGLMCPDEVELDVHRTLSVGAHGLRIPLDDLFATPDHFALGGRLVAAPKRTHRALHAAYHAVIGTPHPALRTLRDLASHLCDPDLPPDVLAAEARRWGGEAVLAEAVQATFDSLCFDAPRWRAWLDTVVVDPREVAILASTHQQTLLPVRWSTLRELSWHDRGAFMWALSFPSAEVLRSRGLTRRGRVVAGVRKVLPDLRSLAARR